MKLVIFSKIETKEKIIDYFPTKSTLRYFECHILSTTMIFYGLNKMRGRKWETDSMLPTSVKLD